MLSFIDGTIALHVSLKHQDLFDMAQYLYMSNKITITTPSHIEQSLYYVVELPVHFSTFCVHRFCVDRTQGHYH